MIEALLYVIQSKEIEQKGSEKLKNKIEKVQFENKAQPKDWLHGADKKINQETQIRMAEINENE